MKRLLISCASIVCATISLPRCASADTQRSDKWAIIEDFSEYPDSGSSVGGSFLGGKNGGIGWSGAWEVGYGSSSTPWYTQVRLTDGSGQCNAPLYYDGHTSDSQSLRYLNFATPDQSNWIARNPAPPEGYGEANGDKMQFGVDGSTIWISFVYRRPAALCGPGILQFWLQQPSGNNPLRLQLPATDADKTNLVLIRIAYGEGNNDKLTYWLNPPRNWSERLAPTSEENGDFNFYRIAWIFENPPSGVSNDSLIDDIRICGNAASASELCIPRGTVFLLR